MRLEVRWHDGYLETFLDIVDWRCGFATLWLEHADGKQEWIPLASVRRFAFDVEAHP